MRIAFIGQETKGFAYAIEHFRNAGHDVFFMKLASSYRQGMWKKIAEIERFVQDADCAVTNSSLFAEVIACAAKRLGRESFYCGKNHGERPEIRGALCSYSGSDFDEFCAALEKACGEKRRANVVRCAFVIPEGESILRELAKLLIAKLNSLGYSFGIVDEYGLFGEEFPDYDMFFSFPYNDGDILDIFLSGKGKIHVRIRERNVREGDSPLLDFVISQVRKTCLFAGQPVFTGVEHAKFTLNGETVKSYDCEIITPEELVIKKDGVSLIRVKLSENYNPVSSVLDGNLLPEGDFTVSELTVQYQDEKDMVREGFLEIRLPSPGSPEKADEESPEEPRFDAEVQDKEDDLWSPRFGKPCVKVVKRSEWDNSDDASIVYRDGKGNRIDGTDIPKELLDTYFDNQSRASAEEPVTGSIGVLPLYENSFDDDPDPFSD